jgi:thiamine pyrophosphokinase
VTTSKVIVLANGDFPKRDDLRQQIRTSDLLICCDGAVDQLRRARIGRKPDVVIGDLDSVKSPQPQHVRIREQNSNDLSKAIFFCIDQKINRIEILGWTGQREDHFIGNFSLFFDFIGKIDFTAHSDFGRLLPLQSGERLSFVVAKGTPISVFSSSNRAKMSSVGLQWELCENRFNRLWHGTLNSAKRSPVKLFARGGAFLIFVGR